MTDQIDQEKSALRKTIRDRLRSMTAEDRHSKSVKVCQRVLALETLRNANQVMLFMPLPTEVDVTPVAIRCFQSGIGVCVPKVDWQRRELMPIEVTRFDDSEMDLDEHGIRVPRGGRLVLPSSIDFVLIPGLAFDTRGNRLGRGCGYYDRFLKRVGRGALRVAVCFDEQIVEHVPTGNGDIGVDIVISDRRCTHVNGAPVK